MVRTVGHPTGSVATESSIRRSTETIVRSIAAFEPETAA